MKERLMKLGAEPTRLYEKFRQRAEESEAEQEDRLQTAHEKLTDGVETIAEYRAARGAAHRLIAEPDLPIDEMSLSD